MAYRLLLHCKHDFTCLLYNFQLHWIMIALYMFTVKSVHVHQIDFLRHMQKDGNDIKNLFHEGLEGNKLPCQFFTKRNYCPNQLHGQYFIKR